jgi:hypothetical protein
LPNASGCVLVSAVGRKKGDQNKVKTIRQMMHKNNQNKPLLDVPMAMAGTLLNETNSMPCSMSLNNCIIDNGL